MGLGYFVVKAGYGVRELCKYGEFILVVIRGRPS
jgi:hypothetical protein